MDDAIDHLWHKGESYGSAPCQKQAMRVALIVQNLGTSIKSTKNWSAFYYHPVPAILNNIMIKYSLHQSGPIPMTHHSGTLMGWIDR